MFTLLKSANWTIGGGGLVFLTCCALRLFSSCSNLVRSRSSSSSRFSQAACSWASALCSLSTFFTYALFLWSSSSSWRLRVCAEARACSISSRFRWHSSLDTRRCWICFSRHSRSRCCSSSAIQETMQVNEGDEALNNLKINLLRFFLAFVWFFKPIKLYHWKKKKSKIGLL